MLDQRIDRQGKIVTCRIGAAPARIKPLQRQGSMTTARLVGHGYALVVGPRPRMMAPRGPQSHTVAHTQSSRFAKLAELCALALVPEDVRDKSYDSCRLGYRGPEIVRI